MSWHLLALLGVAGAAGALCRHAVYLWFGGAPNGSLLATLAVNCAGSFLFGLVYVLAEEHGWGGPAVRTAVLVGFLGSFTTFSTFAFETGMLLRQGNLLHAALHVALQNLGTLASVFAGMLTARGIA